MDFSSLIDISMDLNEQTLVWIADDQPQLRPVLRQPEHDCNFTWLDFGAHAGTHVDAPYYLFAEKWTSEQVPLQRLLGPCQVLDLSHVEDMIDVAQLEALDLHHERVLLRTRNSDDDLSVYNPDHVALTVQAARYLVDQGVQTIGYDYQSFERGGATDVHRVFMAADVAIIDNLRLADAPAADYTLLCLPIKLTGIEAALCRAVLLPAS